MTETSELEDEFTYSIGKGILQRAKRHLEKGDQKKAEGASEQAIEHQGRAGEEIDKYFKSPELWVRLSSNERRQYKNLNEKRIQGKLSDEEFERYKYLGNKATGNVE